MLGAGLLATGVLRTAPGLKMDGTRSRGGIIGPGAVTALLGVLIVASWPSSGVLVPGTFLGTDLLVCGITWIVFAFRLGVRKP